MVEYETSDIDSKLDVLFGKLSNEEDRGRLVDDIMTSISYNAFHINQRRTSSIIKL